MKKNYEYDARSLAFTLASLLTVAAQLHMTSCQGVIVRVSHFSLNGISAFLSR